MLLIEHYTAQSPIHGIGVFSSANVKFGQKVWSFNSLVDAIISVAESKKLLSHTRSRLQHHAEFLAERDAFLITWDGALFMNHSDQPTLVNRDGEMFAAQDICPGDELTCDYRQMLVLGFDPETGMPHASAQMPAR